MTIGFRIILFFELCPYRITTVTQGFFNIVFFKGLTTPNAKGHFTKNRV
ncbi:MAG: hypothetical protein A4E39_01046 [Methanoregulaceae archaeon PtaB.Bin152]|nr:MAG: hypothetical protein A4E39_01046 [Methanoregulaceae archaeon PtaB.Bin152]